jgi:hypothetical protein
MREALDLSTPPARCSSSNLQRLQARLLEDRPVVRLVEPASERLHRGATGDGKCCGSAAPQHLPCFFQRSSFWPDVMSDSPVGGAIKGMMDLRTAASRCRAARVHGS